MDMGMPVWMQHLECSNCLSDCFSSLVLETSGYFQLWSRSWCDRYELNLVHVIILCVPVNKLASISRPIVFKEIDRITTHTLWTFLMQGMDDFYLYKGTLERRSLPGKYLCPTSFSLEDLGSSGSSLERSLSPLSYCSGVSDFDSNCSYLDSGLDLTGTCE